MQYPPDHHFPTIKKFLDFGSFKNDLLGGLTAGIVALPLALAFGEQSGLGAASGLYGAVFIGFFAALFGGTPTQISGPTAPMTALSMVIVAEILQRFEGKLELALPVILMVFVLAGIFQLVMGALRLGSFIKYIPYTVVSGFMTGIGVIIIITQILPAIGYYSDQDEQVVQGFLPHAEELILDRILMEEAQDGILVLEELEETARRAKQITPADIQTEALLLAANDSKGVIGSIRYLPRALSRSSWIELLMALSTIGIIYGFKYVIRSIPSTLVALLVVASAAHLLQLQPTLISPIPSGYPTFHFEIITGFNLPVLVAYIIPALMLAMLGAIDSLLTSVVADNLTKTQHDPDKELLGQGIGNSIAALFGGIPGAGATIRTVVNIQAGGRTKISGMTAGLLLLIILLLLGPIASMIPAAVLAGILITVGFGVMDWKGLKALPRMENYEMVILLVVLALTVFWQLVYAVAVGLVLASVVFLKRMSDLSNRRVLVTNLSKVHEKDPLWEDEVEIPAEVRKRVIFKHLSGPMFFGIVNHFRSTVSEFSDIHLLVLRMEKVPFIDQSGIYALESAIEELHKRQVIVVISSVNAQGRSMLKKMRVVPQLVEERLVFKNFEECRAWLREILTTDGGLEQELELLKKK